jgi:hypothetical protein
MSHSSNAHVPSSTSGVEEDFIDFKGVYGFGIGLAVVTIISHILMLWMFKAEVAAVDASNPPRVYPLAVLQDDRQPPEPRLQTNPRQDLADLRAAEAAVLSGYSWVDRNNQIVRIPVADAMRLTLQRGLPSRPEAAAAAAPAAAPAANPEATQEKK